MYIIEKYINTKSKSDIIDIWDDMDHESKQEYIGYYYALSDGTFYSGKNPNNKPNNKPYKDGAHYTGKEHSWDEAFGYWGAAAHSLKLSAKENYDITKMKNLAAADANGDGVVDLKSEYNFAHSYYASSFDKGGKTNYFNTVTQAFLDGRQIITNANGNKLTDSQFDFVIKFVIVLSFVIDPIFTNPPIRIFSLFEIEDLL